MVYVGVRMHGSCHMHLDLQNAPEILFLTALDTKLCRSNLCRGRSNRGVCARDDCVCGLWQWPQLGGL